METRARFILIGFFVLGVIAAGFVFVYWLNYAGGLRAQTTYLIRFENSVPGLRPGSSVLFNGIRVGEVTSLRLNPDDPKEVTALISVERGTPIRTDTQVGVYTQGLMGSPTIALHGGSPAAPALTSVDGQPPKLRADPEESQDVMQAARGVLRRLDTVLTENAEPLRNTIANLNTFADALARNSDRLDSIAAGLERMVGTPEKAPTTIYDLHAPRTFPPLPKIPEAQLVVLEPTAILMLDTQKILAHATVGEPPVFPDSQWSDSLPKLFQARIVQSFENAGYGRVDRENMDGIEADYKLSVDIRMFRLSVSPQPVGEAEFGAKLVDKDGRVVDTRIFRAQAPAKSADAPAAAAALDEAFGKAVTDLVLWTVGTI